MAVVISLFIAVVAVAFVAAPFFFATRRSPEPAAKDPDASDALADLLAEKETVYAAIQELDFDFKSGKLSAEDHDMLRRRHEEHAASVLKRIDVLQGKPRQEEAVRAGRREKRKR
ncbi:MAG TPA: hypothetical protein VLT62_01180 [Candidatus Methylomirabilis sp.]|nr:hypothetical protein [Candidatus Methylomirabilis sp.]